MQKKENVSVRQIAVDVLQAVYGQQAYANIALNKVISQNTLKPLDRKFLTELVYGTVKTTNTLDFILGKFLSRPLHKIPPMIVNILRMAVYQIFYMDKIPVSAACNESVNLAKKYAHIGTVKFVNGVLRNIIRNRESVEFPTMEMDAVVHISLKYHHPEWLVRLWLQEFGEQQTVDLCTANNATPLLSGRTNTLRIQRDELLELLRTEGIVAEPSKYSGDGFVVREMQASLAETKSFQKGLWHIQDESSMLVAEILNPTANTTTIDVCAAPGGKTTHLAQKMCNQGRIVAFDIYEHKLELIRENAQKLGVNIIEARLQDAQCTVEELLGSADSVLVDAPCSGLGVLRRRADARWRKQPSDLSVFAPLQTEILQQASKYVKLGGYLVYSTCTIRKEENQDVVENFLNTHADFVREDIVHPSSGERVAELCLYPHIDHTDGFFIAKMRRIK